MRKQAPSRDGFYHATFGGSGGIVRAVFVLESGKLYGQGERGASYEGCYDLDAVRNVFAFTGTVTIPPSVITASGVGTGQQGVTLPFKGESALPDPVARYSLDLAGKAVDVAMRYVSPLPSPEVRSPMAPEQREHMFKEGIYHAVFEDGALLGQGVLVLRRGKVGGVGHDIGEYSGGYSFDAANNRLTLDLDVRVPAKTPITKDLKAGPAGSTVRIEGQGPAPDPLGRYTVTFAGQPAVLSLRFMRALPG
jgi:hypothetical protein